MKNFSKKIIYTAAFSVLILCMLFYPQVSLEYALIGLDLWYRKMIPTLLPFMIVTNMMIRLDLNSTLMSFFAPLLKPVFRINKHCLYGIFVGFLCGFPIGAKVTADLYRLGRITKDEAEYLLSFCNNIGPIYFTGFVLLALDIQQKIPYIVGMYGIPILYGIILRHTYYRNRISLADGREKPLNTRSELSVFWIIDESINGSLQAIARLGGYMIFFNLLNLIPHLLFTNQTLLLSFFNCGLEITSGINWILCNMSFLAQKQAYLLIFTMLTAGGVSCLAQTYSILKGSGLSIRKYAYHKLILTAVSMVYYWVLLF